MREADSVVVSVNFVRAPCFALVVEVINLFRVDFEVSGSKEIIFVHEVSRSSEGTIVKD